MERLGGLVLACLLFLELEGLRCIAGEERFWSSGGVLEYVSTLRIREVE